MFSTTDLLVGVDIHRRTNVVQVMSGDGQLLTSKMRVSNNRPGTVTDELFTMLPGHTFSFHYSSENLRLRFGGGYVNVRHEVA